MKVKFTPQNVEHEIKENETVLNLAQDNGLHIRSICKGVPSCAECRVTVSDGWYNVMPPSPDELNLIGTAYFVDRRRLSCQLRCFGDITIDLTDQVAKEGEVAKSKRPRGYVHKEVGERTAVMGNIMQEEQSQADLNERTANLNLQDEETRRELDKIRQKKGGSDQGRSGRGGDQQTERPSHHRNRKPQANSRPNQARPSSQTSDQAQSAKTQVDSPLRNVSGQNSTQQNKDSQNRPNKKRSNRNRRRHRKPENK